MHCTYTSRIEKGPFSIAKFSFSHTRRQIQGYIVQQCLTLDKSFHTGTSKQHELVAGWHVPHLRQIEVWNRFHPLSFWNYRTSFVFAQKTIRLVPLAPLLLAVDSSSKSGTSTKRRTCNRFNATPIASIFVLVTDVFGANNATEVCSWSMKNLRNIFKKGSSTRWTRYLSVEFVMRHDVVLSIHTGAISTVHGQLPATFFISNILFRTLSAKYLI